MSLARRFLSSDLAAKTEQKAIELSTPDRVYCSNTKCGAFIVPGRIDWYYFKAACTYCGQETCALCKQQDHKDPCPKDRETEQVMELAEEEGWKRCAGCSAVIELQTGCNHMT